MRKLRRTMIIAISVMLIASCLCIFYVNASEGSWTLDDFTNNFTTKSGAYGLTSGCLATNEDGTPVDFGFKYSVDEKGGIRVESPAQTEGSVVATNIVTTKEKLPLDGLSVTIQPDKFDFTKDGAGRSNSFTILWTDVEIGDMNRVGHYDYTGTNGIREIAAPSKGLAIVINNSYEKYSRTMTASNVMITYISGHKYDAIDQRLGFRWSFTARNNYSQSPCGDYTGIRQSYEELDISNGLTVSVRADEEHGYIVSLNGVDYYESSKIAYYPNNVEDQYAENSYTYTKDDIDLSGLKDVEDGYLSIACCGNEIVDSSYSYTITEINGAPACDIAAE